MKRLFFLLAFLTFSAARFVHGDSVVVFNEIMYHPAMNEPDNEWVELRNLLAADVDLSDWSLSGGIEYTFPSNSIVKGGDFVVVAINPAALKAATGLTTVFGPFTGRLNNGGEILRIRNNSGRVMDEVDYGVEGDWPVAPDGSGASLAKRDSNTASGPAQNWTASEQVGGTPGAANFAETTGFIAPTGLISYWNFNEPSGLAATDLAGQNHGTLGSAVVRMGSGIGGELSFNGTSNAYVNVGVGNNNNFAVGGSITIEAVLKPGWTSTNSAVIFKKAPRRPGAYRDVVLTNQPIAYWRLGDATTNIADSAANGRNGTATAGVQLNQASLIASDPSNPAARFTGTERVTVPGFEKIGAAGYTVEYWVRPQVLPTSCCQNLVGDGELAGDYFMMNYILGPVQGVTGAIRPHFGPANTPVSMDSTTALQVSNTYHIVATWDTSLVANNAVIYVNGLADRVGTITRNLPPAGTTGANRVYIGKDDRDTTDGTEIIDEVALYNRPLSPADVVSHFTAATFTDQNQGNAVQLAFQNDGNNGAANPPVAAGPVLSFGLTVGGNYSELDMPLDGQAGRPTLGALEDGQPHHVAATYSSATGVKAIFVDGVLRFSMTLSGSVSANNLAPAILGNSEVNGDSPFVGTLDEMAYWGRALSATEVAAHSSAVQAGRDYFTPAAQDAAVKLAFNEFSASTNAEFWLELINYGTNPVPLQGYVIIRDGMTSSEYVFPAGSPISPGGYRAVTNTTLGFHPVSGDKLYLLPPSRDKVLDAVVVKTAPRARSPEGTGPFLRPSASSPGAANSFALHNEIVINEIMYHHTALPGTSNSPPRESPEAWIELYNRSSNDVNLTGWELSGGISYIFTPGQIIPRGGYLVVADDVPYLRALYPSINIVGDFGGRLGHAGDHIVLKDATGNPADEVRYFDRSPWPEYADGGGSSLELCDARLDNSKPEAWAASYEGDKSSWVTNSYRMIANIPAGNGQPTAWADFIFGLQAAGECLIDDLSVIESPSGTPVQLIANGNFESGLSGWRVLGTHGHSTIEVDPQNPGNHVLHLVATGPQEHMHNHVERTLNNQRLPQNGLEYQISYRAKWVAGNNLLNTRLYFNRSARTLALPMPPLNGTPGAPNSDHGRSGIPTFSGLAHQPVVPQPGEAVTVSVKAEHFDGPPTCQLYWSVNGGASNFVAMTSSGGGLYTGTIPAQSAGARVQFWILGERLGADAYYPDRGPDSGALYTVADGQANLNSGHNIRIILTPANVELLQDRDAATGLRSTNVMSNDRLPCTVIYDERRAYYNVGIRLKGSERGRANVDRISYHLEFPADDLFRGVHPFMLVDRSGAGDATSNKQQEILIKHILLRAGNVPSTQPDLCRVIAPRTAQTGSAILSPRHEDEFVETAFENGGDGTMWELELIYYPNGGQTNQYGYKFVLQPPPNNDSVTGTDISDVGNDKETYRYNFIIKNHRDDDNYAPFMNFAKTWSLPSGPLLDQQTRQVMDVDEWMRVWALVTLCGVGDSYTFGNNHNLFMYLRPSDQKMVAFPVDMDFSFNRGSTSPLIGDQNLSRIISLPANLRSFYGHILDIINVSYNTGYMAYWINHYQSLTSPQQNYSAVLSYIQQRAAFAITTINGQAGTNFNVTGTNVITTTNNLVTLNGVAPAQVKTILVNGVEFPITWTSIAGWRLVLPVSSPTNVLNIAGYDLHGNLLTNFVRTVTVNYNGPTPPDPQGNVVINEIMYNPLSPDGAYLELLNASPTFSFDLSDWRINGLDYTFPKGTVLTNRQLLVVAASMPAYVAAYGTNGAAPFDQFAGNLQNDGETLTLFRPGANAGEEIIVDKVRYESAPPWPVRPNGTGPSLQLIDPAQDNSRVGNWSDGSGWRRYSFTGTPGQNATNLILYLNGAGDLYIDGVSIVEGSVPGVGPNLVPNGDFEGATLSPWTPFGNHSGSAVSSTVSYDGSKSMHVVATAGGGSGGGLSNTFPALVSNVVHTFSFWYLPSTNGSSFQFRVTTGFRAVNGVDYRPVSSTPGTPNTVASLLPPFPPLWLNEVQPENISGILDNMGEREPWIELYNAGSGAINLAGYYLANNYTNLAQWAFPGDAVIQPGEFKVIYADGQPGQTSGTNLHTSFRLNASTGSVALVWSPGGAPQVLDYLNYQGIPPGRSYGAYPDGQPFDRQEFLHATPRATNDNTAAPLVAYINEWMASNTRTLLNTNNGNRYDDWFELYNPGNSAVNLAGYFLTDNSSNKFQFAIPPGYSIPAHGFLLVWADGKPELNTNTDTALHVSFKLDRDGEQIGLFASDGTQIDGVTFEPQFDDFSQGHFPDGTGPVYFLVTPTPRAPNTSWANRYPVMDPIPDADLFVGQPFNFMAVAADPDVPPQILAFSLNADAPTGAVINASSGLFSWTPTSAQAPGTNFITVHVTDNGTPALAAARTFRVTVTAGVRVSGISRTMNGEISISFGTIPGKTYRVEYKNRLGDAMWTPLGADTIAASSTLSVIDSMGDLPQRFYRIVQLD